MKRGSFVRASGGVASAMAAAGALVTACSSSSAPPPRGLELIVVADGLSAPGDFDDIRLEIAEVSGSAPSTLWNRDYVVPSQEAMLPAEFSLLSSGSAREVVITVTAFKRATGEPVVQRVAQVQVPTDRLADLYLVLSKVCVGKVTSTGAEAEPQSTCQQGQSCQPTGVLAGQCGTNLVDPKSLPAYMPGQGFDLDAAIAVVSDGSSGAGSSGAADASGDQTVNASSSGASSSGSSGAGSGSSTSGASSGGSSGSGTDGGEAGVTVAFSVYQHHKNGTRDGVYVEPTFTKTAVATMHRTTLMGSVTTSVYAQPLYAEVSPAGPVFVVATEQNHVTAISVTSGSIVWDTGPPVIGQPVTGGLGCGNVNPLGITGTPFIDPTANGGAGAVYFDAMTTPDSNVTFKHLVYALSLVDGSKLAGWPLDVSAKVSGFTSGVQSQRGALQLVNGVLYVPYGGMYGDCGSYHGSVVAIPVATPQSPTSWRTSATMGGIWGTGALATDGASIFAATGNTSSPATWGGGEAVLRLGAGATFNDAGTDYYAPSNWLSLDNSDLDLGGSSAVLFDMPGGTVPHLVAIGGKDGNLYLLDRDNLGGVGGELKKVAVSTSTIMGAPAAYTTSSGTYVALRSSGTGVGCAASGNLVVVKIVDTAPPTATVAWCSSKASLGSPMVTTTDGSGNAVVWAANDALWGFDGDTGALVAGGTTGATDTSMATAIQSFNAPISAHGKMAVGVNGSLYVFTP